MSPNLPAAKTSSVLVVALGYVRDLAPRLSSDAVKAYGDRPVWFYRTDVDEKAKIFTRVPETSGTTDESDEVMEVIENLEMEFRPAIRSLLAGPETVCFGFHLDATYEAVLEALQAEGFDVRPIPFSLR